MQNVIRIFNDLTKVKIAILTTASALTGYVLSAHVIDLNALPMLLGVFLLACGAGALNEWQERDIDGLMKRTMNRPLPTGVLTAPQGLAISLILIAAGTLCLAFNATAMALGLVTVVWYNIIYTNLKRVSAFAAIPGGVVGAIPPVIGFVAGGGTMTDPKIAAVAFFFFVWQVPHFWLLLLKFGEDYERAGLPTLTAIFSRAQLARVTYVWMLATAVSCLLIPLFGAVTVGWIPMAFLIASIWLGWAATNMVRTNGKVLAFKEINLYALVVISLLSIGGLLDR